MDFNGATTLQQEMRRQELDAIQYLPNGYDYNFLEENGDLFEGSYVLTQFVPFEAEDPPEALGTYEDWIDQTGGTLGELSLAGWISADMFVTGLRAAGPEFSQQGVIDGLNQLTDYNAEGIIPGPGLDHRTHRGRGPGVLGALDHPRQRVRAPVRRTGRTVHLLRHRRHRGARATRGLRLSRGHGGPPALSP